MNAMKIFLMTALLTAAAMSAFGQQMPAAGQPANPSGTGRIVGNPAQPGGGEPLSAEKQEEIRKRVDMVRIWRLTGVLKLDADTSAKLSAFLNTIDQQRRNLHREKMGTIRTLQLAVKAPKPDEVKLKADLDKIEKNNRAMLELTMFEMNGLKNFLTIEQQARYVAFQHEFMHEMRGMIGSAAGGVTGTGGGYMRGGMGMGVGPTSGGMMRGGPTVTTGK